MADEPIAPTNTTTNLMETESVYQNPIPTDLKELSLYTIAPSQYDISAPQDRKSVIDKKKSEMLLAKLQHEEKKPKKKKLTKQEKIELKKQKKLLRIQKALEAKKQGFRDHLLRELKYTELTYKRAYQDWQRMCKDIKLKELTDDLMWLWQGINRMYDQKNSKIQRLLNDLDTAEEQYRRNFSKHVEFIDRLTEFFQYCMDTMKEMYEANAFEMIRNFTIQMNRINRIQNERKSFYEDVVHASNVISKERLTELKQQFEEQKTEVIDLNILKRYSYHDGVINKMTQLYKQMQAVILNAQKDAVNPHQRRQCIEKLEKQKAAQKEFIQMKQAADKGQVQIENLTTKLNQYQNKYTGKIWQLENEQKEIIAYYWNIKHNHKKEIELAESQLSFMANESYEVIRDLKKQVKYGELLLGLAQCCRKLQTEKEKILPWPPHSETGNVQFINDAQMIYVEQMHLFVYRLSRVKTHVLYLREEKRQLEEEHARYCDILKSCFGVDPDKNIRRINVNPEEFTDPLVCPKCGHEKE